jgi:DNA-binding transcriptional LysR family regulator
MRLSQLEAFLAVYDSGSISRASIAVRVSQPALTKTIRLLELELGARLFQRCPRGMEPTVCGHSLAPHARSVSVEMKQARSQIAAIAKGLYGNVRVGAGPYVVGEIIPIAVTTVMAKYPELQVEIVTGSNERLITAVEAGDIELCVVSPPRDEKFDQLATIELSHDEFAIIARTEHPLTRSPMVTLSDVTRFPWVFIGKDFAATSHLVPALQAQGLDLPSHITETDSLTYLISHLLKSDSLSYQPRHLIEVSRVPGLQIIEVPEAARQFRLIIGHRKSGVLSPGADELIAALRGSVAGRATQGGSEQHQILKMVRPFAHLHHSA